MAKIGGKVTKVEEAAKVEEVHTEEPPRGTLVIMLIYLVLIVVLWGSMFLIMLERS